MKVDVTGEALKYKIEVHSCDEISGDSDLVQATVKVGSKELGPFSTAIQSSLRRNPLPEQVVTAPRVGFELGEKGAWFATLSVWKGMCRYQTPEQKRAAVDFLAKILGETDRAVAVAIESSKR